MMALKTKHCTTIGMNQQCTHIVILQCYVANEM